MGTHSLSTWSRQVLEQLPDVIVPEERFSEKIGSLPHSEMILYLFLLKGKPLWLKQNYLTQWVILAS
jgi:hypothetical protein